ncbi:tyrosine protein phosphatase [Virgibacillus halodenitrificans]|uniref:tyrosine-protein phosphatase n=1 Tax=Virgibacillus halodenitrificans TaxID=1482 RepID=UPI001FB4FE25|nr:CpsB/CapC family capsule biosynthesis tyrosine phosphatase [Virgibacillus halodenitrificans]MCJ0929713.1 tyrosine protein phosphatase [Virgibacillus halodenitrificans]
MIDIHSHILPGMDDGAATIEDSEAMARAAVADGIHTIIATPHHQNGKYNNEKAEILPSVDQLNSHLQEKGIPLLVLPGQENRLHGELVTHLKAGQLVTLANETDYVFVEFPSGHVPRYAKQMLFDIQVAGFKPVIVHPERNREIMEHPSVLYNFVDKGALSQVTAASIAGKFGKNVQKFAHQLIEADLTHFVASDAHNTTSRGFCMQEAFEEVSKRHGSQTSFFLMENAQLLVEGLNVNRNEPEQVKRKKFLGLF